jgi:hypothetical protein
MPGIRRYAWASLREALSGYPGLSAQVPDRAGTVRTVHVREGAKPGPVSGSVVITEAEIEAARKGLTVSQGTFTGAHEVKT